MKKNNGSISSAVVAGSIIACAVGAYQSAWAQPDCVWGSFDETRINYASGPLNGSAHTTLRNIITSNGGTVAPGTPTLTDAYLSGKEVFYTSLLSTTTGTLSGDEQTALQNWIADGGTLIVTADIFPLPAYESFTSFYGVTGYTDIGACSVNGNTVASHPITDSVNQYYYCTESTYSYNSDAMLLGDNSSGGDFLIVMEPGTGFSAGGRILVFGDHNMFTESFINNSDNIQLANNMAAWACVPPGPCLDMSVSTLTAGQTGTWDISGADANSNGVVAWGLTPGQTVVNGTFGYCATFGINGVNQNRVVGFWTADGNGDAQVQRRIPGNVSGLEVHTQAAQQGTCPDECMSDVDTQTIQ